MENNQIKQTTNSCSCDCTVCRMGHHRLLRVVVLILALLIAFCLGTKFGEFRGYMHGGDDWGRGDRWMMNGKWYPMMQYAPAPATGTAPTTAPQTTPAAQ